MGSNVSGRAYPEAGLAGHLLTGDGRLAPHGVVGGAVGAGATARKRTGAAALYRGVLTWLVTALADVVVARSGPGRTGRDFVLEVRTTAGRTVGAGELPQRLGRVGRSALALRSPATGTSRRDNSWPPTANRTRRCRPPRWSGRWCGSTRCSTPRRRPFPHPPPG
ncbi:hypothetical protein HYG77_37895 (plasmid) [Rhodococcus sp. ZPP]|uniref:hypothetical protein n=1 Tax=Rhodococcus sp. ZPP TaxID=2749906 RepID=UPI001AD89AED|nr:hypothetical protein [Rhodococcus sp. ZPP]QTJ71204.1 hypothetical protein HYG77_37895 [Rhodococcus sp. ZPP]